MESVGRNDPCPCGSGLKYKKCCLSQGAQAAVSEDHAAGEITQAIKHMSERRWDEAIDLLKSALPEAKSKHQVLVALAACYEGLDQYLHATEYYEKALKESPESGIYDTTLLLGVARACAGRIEKAEDAFEQCVDLAPSEDQKAQVTKALDLIRLIREGRERPEAFQIVVQLQKASTDLDEDRFVEAAYRLERIAEIDPREPVIPYNLGVAYTFLHREDDALAQFERAVELAPAYAEAWYNMGQICLIKKQDHSRALHYFDMAAHVRPDYVSAHHQRGVALEHLGDIPGAVKAFENVLQIDPDNATAKKSLEKINNQDSARAVKQSAGNDV
ncbi:MAG: tetratricopeptide repeat protein [Thermodesulfobacteriota bacterium]